MKNVTANPESEIRVLKSATCPSLSGKSKLTYLVGCTAKSEILFRVHSNNGGGFFSNEWVSMNAIQQVLDKSPNNKAITSYVLHKLFQGKSLNTPAFLVAALQNEGLLKASKEKKRCFEANDPKEFMTRMKALIQSSGNQKAEIKQKPAAAGNQKSAMPGKKSGPKASKKKA